MSNVVSPAVPLSEDSRADRNLLEKSACKEYDRSTRNLKRSSESDVIDRLLMDCEWGVLTEEALLSMGIGGA